MASYLTVSFYFVSRIVYVSILNESSTYYCCCCYYYYAPIITSQKQPKLTPCKNKTKNKNKNKKHTQKRQVKAESHMVFVKS